MITIPVELSKSLMNRANNFSDFRTKCKKYLENNGIFRDKFTITQNDSLLGYITEELIANYLRNRFKGRICVSKWQDQFDMDYIRSIIHFGKNSQEDIDLICNYFYDSFDLYVSTPSLNVFISIKIDVKTAITKKVPQGNWEFMYPVVQANKLGKDLAILVYFVVEDVSNPFSLNKLVLAGYMKEEDITKCDIIKKGELTSHKTPSQIDNYVTYVRDYHDIEELFKDIKD